MLQKTKTFLEVARCLNFTEAAYALGVSQSAVSQSLSALEKELGVMLVNRSKRNISLTPAGSHFANEAERILSEFDELVVNVRNRQLATAQTLRIAYLNVYRGHELEKAVVEFSSALPNIAMDLRALSHEEIYRALTSEQIDIALSDQRRAFSEDFENTVLAETPIYVDISTSHPLANKKRLSVSDIKNQNCILIAPKAFQKLEQDYYAGLLSFKGQFLFAETLGAAQLMTSSGRGFMLSQGIWEKTRASEENTSTIRLPLFKSGRLVKERFCAFYLKTRNNPLIKAFSSALQRNFR